MHKIKVYEIWLENNKAKLYDRIALYIILINLAIFIYHGIAATTSIDRIIPLLCACLVIGSLSLPYFLPKHKLNSGIIFMLLAELIITTYWLIITFWWVAGLMAILCILFFLAKKPLVIKVTLDNIIFPSFPHKIFSWHSLNNVLLKDGIITIDSKNNTLLQLYVDEKKTAVNEKEFNDFCREQLIT